MTVGTLIVIILVVIVMVSAYHITQLYAAIEGLLIFWREHDARLRELEGDFRSDGTGGSHSH